MAAMSAESNDPPHRRKPQALRVLTISVLPVLTFFLTLLTPGCILPQRRMVHEVQQGRNPQQDPPHLRQWQRESTVRFLLVHGMGNHPFGSKGDTPNLLGKPTYRAVAEELARWNTLPQAQRDRYAGAALFQFADFVTSYARRAGLTETAGGPAALEFHPLVSSRGRVSGYIFKRAFQPAAGQGPPVIFYVASWSLGAAVEKEKTYGSWDGLTKQPPSIEGEVGDFESIIDSPRRSLNRKLKHSFVNWGLTDASLYVGPMAGELEWTVAAGMDTLAAELQPGDRAAVVTASLGSAITYNAILKLVRHQFIDGRPWRWSAHASENLRGLFFPAEGQESGGCSIAFYMFANQYGLLTAGRSRGATPATDQANPVNVLQAAVTAAQSAPPPRRMHRARVRRPVELVAFTDPDDPLSFGMPGKKPGVATTNVYVRNNSWMAWVPFFGLVSDPLNAHGGYGRNPLVLDMMLDGVKKR